MKINRNVTIEFVRASMAGPADIRTQVDLPLELERQMRAARLVECVLKECEKRIRRPLAALKSSCV